MVCALNYISETAKNCIANPPNSEMCEICIKPFLFTWMGLFTIFISWLILAVIIAKMKGGIIKKNGI